MTDIDPRASDVARENAALNGVGGVRVYIGDALDAVPDSAFDRILVESSLPDGLFRGQTSDSQKFQPPENWRPALHGHQAAGLVF